MTVRASGMSRAAKAWTLVVLVVIVVLMRGAYLDQGIGRSFVYFHDAQYHVVGWIAACLMAPFLGLAFANPTFQASLSIKAPRWWQRWLFMFPILAGLTMAMVVTAPMGYLAKATLDDGQWVEDIPATIVAVQSHNLSKKGCDQYATFSVHEVTNRLCLEGHLRLPASAGPVLVNGKQTPYGLLIAFIKPQPPPAKTAGAGVTPLVLH